MFSAASQESAENTDIRMYQISDNNNVKQANYKSTLKIDPNFYANITDSLEILTPQRFVFGTYKQWAESTDSTSRDFYQQSPIVQSKCATIDDKVIFPYVQKDDTDYKVASVIAMNSYQHTMKLLMNSYHQINVPSSIFLLLFVFFLCSHRDILWNLK